MSKSIVFSIIGVAATIGISSTILYPFISKLNSFTNSEVSESKENTKSESQSNEVSVGTPQDNTNSNRNSDSNMNENPNFKLDEDSILELENLKFNPHKNKILQEDIPSNG